MTSRIKRTFRRSPWPLFAEECAKEPMEIFHHQQSGASRVLQGKATKVQEQNRAKILTASKIGIPLVIIALAAWLIVAPWLKSRMPGMTYARHPGWIKADYIPSVKAFDLAREAKQIIGWFPIDWPMADYCHDHYHRNRSSRSRSCSGRIIRHRTPNGVQRVHPLVDVPIAKGLSA